MALNFSPALGTAYADGSAVNKAHLRGHLTQLAQAVDGVPAIFASLSAFQGATIPAGVSMVTVMSPGGEILGYRRQPGANGPEDLTHPNGSRWAKATLSEADLLAAVTDAIAAANFLAVGAGTFVPVVSSQTAGLSLSGGGAVGRYNRIGSQIFWHIDIVGRTAARGAGAGALLISGFPLASDPNSANGGTVLRLGGISSLSGGTPPANLTFAMFPAGAYGHIYANYANGTYRTLNVDDVSTAAGAITLRMSGFYEVAS